MNGFDSLENRRPPACCHLPAAWLWQPSMFPNLKTFSFGILHGKLEEQNAKCFSCRLFFFCRLCSSACCLVCDWCTKLKRSLAASVCFKQSASVVIRRKEKKQAGELCQLIVNYKVGVKQHKTMHKCAVEEE